MEKRLEKALKALESARHELVTLNGLLGADAVAPSETFAIDTGKAIAEIDEAISGLSQPDSCP